MGSREIHAETAQGWNVVAESKYRSELDSRVALLRSGGHNLLDIEIEELRGLLPGSSVVHLQCSHGLDGLSLLNLGASQIVGIDISSEMIQLARDLTRELGLTAQWYCSDVVDPPPELEGSADLVYTGKGSLPWIMDLEAWALAVQRILKPGGHIYLLEGHPLDNLWDRESKDLRVRADGLGYFESEAIENAGFPAEAVKRERPDSTRPRMREKFWRPDQIMAALGRAGLIHEGYREHPDLYWNQFPHWPEGLKKRLPHSYSLRYRRPLQP